MDIEQNVVCEKIIGEIDSVFKKNPDLLTFEIIPLTTNQNKSPVVHVNNNLGLESWCVPHVYEFAHKIILNRKLENSKYFNETNVLKYLNCAILINPDVSTFWNVRRQLFERNKLNISKEFQFSSIVLSKKPKSNEAFFYRRWLYSFQSSESIDWSFEIGLCERCSDRSSSNYHAWSHRQWVLQKAPYLLKYEMRFTERFIRKHITDYSAFHHRQFILQKLYELDYLNYHRHEQHYQLRSNCHHLIIDNNINSCSGNKINDVTSSETLTNISNTSMTTNSTNVIDSCLENYPFLVKFCRDINVMKISTINDLIKFILPNISNNRTVINCGSTYNGDIDNNINSNNTNNLDTFLFCLNFAFYDLAMCRDLTQLFGYRESFELHRRSVVKFIVYNCNELDNANNVPVLRSKIEEKEVEERNLIDTQKTNDENQQPLSKISKIDEKHNAFLKGIRDSEVNNANNNKWCQIFLDFR